MGGEPGQCFGMSCQPHSPTVAADIPEIGDARDSAKDDNQSAPDTAREDHETPLPIPKTLRWGIEAADPGRACRLRAARHERARESVGRNRAQGIIAELCRCPLDFTDVEAERSPPYLD